MLEQSKEQPTLDEMLVPDERGFLPGRLELVERADGSLLMRGDASPTPRDYWLGSLGVACFVGVPALALVIWLTQRSSVSSFSWIRFAVVCAGGLVVLGLFAMFHRWAWSMHRNSMSLIANGIGDLLLWEPTDGGAISTRSARYRRSDVVAIRCVTGWISDGEDQIRISQIQLAVRGGDPKAGFEVFPIVSATNSPISLGGRSMDEMLDRIGVAADLPVRRYKFKLRGSADMDIVRRKASEVRTWPMNPVRLGAESLSEVRR